VDIAQDEMGVNNNRNIYGSQPYDDDGMTLIADLPGFPVAKEGIERFFITDINNPAGAAQAQSTIFIMWDAFGSGIVPDNSSLTEAQVGNIQQFNHVPGGCNVLYMDGHVEFVRWGSGPPCWLPEGSGVMDGGGRWVYFLNAMGGVG
jgi:prepilin-type processing-associated H-X9-DG protein